MEAPVATPRADTLALVDLVIKERIVNIVRQNQNPLNRHHKVYFIEFK